MTRRDEDDREPRDWSSQDRDQRGLRWGREGQQGTFRGSNEQSNRERGGFGERSYGEREYGEWGQEGARRFGEGEEPRYGERGSQHQQAGGDPRYGDDRNRWGYGQSWGNRDFGGYGGAGYGGSVYGGTINARDVGRGQGTYGSYGQGASRGGFAGKGPRGYVRSDERVREEICDRLSRDDEVDASDIGVTVSQGEVTLDGTVPDRHTKRRAEDIAEDVAGVKDVHNQLKANKGLIDEVGDKLMGREAEHGHAGSGTRNSASGTIGAGTVAHNGR